jgi:hypothetical protein
MFSPELEYYLYAEKNQICFYKKKNVLLSNITKIQDNIKNDIQFGERPFNFKGWGLFCRQIVYTILNCFEICKNLNNQTLNFRDI